MSKKEGGTQTGPFPHKDSPNIDLIPMEQMEKMATFKGAKFVNTEFLTKKNAVNDACDEWYHPHESDPRR